MKCNPHFSLNNVISYFRDFLCLFIQIAMHFEIDSSMCQRKTPRLFTSTCSFGDKKIGLPGTKQRAKRVMVTGELDAAITALCSRPHGCYHVLVWKNFQDQRTNFSFINTGVVNERYYVIMSYKRHTLCRYRHSRHTNPDSNAEIK